VLRRTGWRRLLFGYSANVAELTAEGVRVSGRGSWEMPFSSFADAKAEGFLGIFGSVRLSALDGRSTEIAGVRKAEAAAFAGAAIEAWRRYLRGEVDAWKTAMLLAAAEVRAMETPDRYPAASIASAILERARSAVAGLPATFPDGILTEDERQALRTIARLLGDPVGFRDRAVAAFVDTELDRMAEFFDAVERNPLTAEQRLAVVADEDATLVLAGAGSGKTSVIVAKAAHLATRRLARPDEILLMSFGLKAAEEMASRVKKRIRQPIAAMTFHGLGNAIIRTAEGRGPPLAPEADDDIKLAALLKEIVLELAQKDVRFVGFMTTWFAGFFAPYRTQFEFETLSDYFAYIREHEIRTLQGERVRSFEECEIANWLFMNGIAYEYEPPYEHEIRSSERRTYTPDFRLIESGVYIEHFGVRKAVGPDGKERLETAPYIDRERYLADMAWKRRIHREHGTTLVETYSYEKAEGRLTDALAIKLAPFVTPAPISSPELFRHLDELGRVDPFTRTLAIFLRHFKGAGLAIDDCRRKAGRRGLDPRDEAFLGIFEPVHARYQERLGGRIDFEDMIVRATRHVTSGRYVSPYRHLLVDEFQDISLGRAKLLKALLDQHPDARLYAVGDDWQAIYRFAGSDVGIMRAFAEMFGSGYAGRTGVHRTVDLGRTFRCVDKVAQPATHFVLRNPQQLPKVVTPAGTADRKAICIVYVRGGDEENALRDVLSQLRGSVQADGKRPSVFLLGRYHFLKPHDLQNLEQAYPAVDLKFLTVHASKGLEADHVVVLGMRAGRMGFPSQVADDPVLAMVLPDAEEFPHAEERRVLYVALTRARWSVHLLADPDDPSPFVQELTKDPAYEVEIAGEAPGALGGCARCGGRMLRDQGANGSARFVCEHGALCGNSSPVCPACGTGMPNRALDRAGVFVCSCGAEYPACSKCGDGWLLERLGRFGTFLGGSHYPDCTATRPGLRGGKAARKPWRPKVRTDRP
jgi:DNA helicase IV